MPPAPGSSRDWMREQPSWRQMDGQDRAFPCNGNLAEKRGRGKAVQGNNLEKREQVQQQIVGCSPQQVDHLSLVLKIWFGPPNADFWSVWSSQKARKFRQIQPMTKVLILCFEWKRICFQTRDVLCSYNMNYEE